jgi:hypothetical protein
MFWAFTVARIEPSGAAGNPVREPALAIAYLLRMDRSRTG